MKITLEIPIDIDEPITADERKQFQEYIQTAASPIISFVESKFGRGPRMFDTVCRFAFGEPVIKVE